MTFEDFLNLVRDKSKTDFQLAADLHAAWQKAATPSALSIKAVKERKKRETKAPKQPGRIGDTLPLANGEDHVQAN